MIKRFFTNFKWFWKESFSYMKGYGKLHIVSGCIKKCIRFCIDMEKWHMAKEKQFAYTNRDF